MGNEQSQPDASAVQPTTTGYHVLKIKPESPAEYAGLQPFFDFILCINDLPLENEDSTLTTTIKNSIDQKVKLTVFNGLRQEFRVVELVPHWWGGPEDGLIGCSIRYCAYAGASEHVWHVLSLSPNSPASEVGLIPEQDYIVASPDTVYYEASDFYDDISSHAEQELSMRLLIYSKVHFTIREVTLRPRHAWGGEGLLGCELGYGALHKIEPVKGKDVAMIHEDSDAHSIAQTRRRVSSGVTQPDQHRQKAEELSTQMSAMGISTPVPSTLQPGGHQEQIATSMSFDSIALGDTPQEENPSLPKQPPPLPQTSNIPVPQESNDMKEYPLTPQPAPDPPKKSGGMFGFASSALSYLADTVAPPPPKEKLMKKRQQLPELPSERGNPLNALNDGGLPAASQAPPPSTSTNAGRTDSRVVDFAQKVPAPPSVASASSENTSISHVARIGDSASVISENRRQLNEAGTTGGSSTSFLANEQDPTTVGTPGTEHSFSAQTQNLGSLPAPPFYTANTPSSYSQSSYEPGPPQVQETSTADQYQSYEAPQDSIPGMAQMSAVNASGLGIQAYPDEGDSNMSQLPSKFPPPPMSSAAPPSESSFMSQAAVTQSMYPPPAPEPIVHSEATQGILAPSIFPPPPAPIMATSQDSSFIAQPAATTSVFPPQTVEATVQDGPPQGSSAPQAPPMFGFPPAVSTIPSQDTSFIPEATAMQSMFAPPIPPPIAPDNAPQVSHAPPMFPPPPSYSNHPLQDSSFIPPSSFMPNVLPPTSAPQPIPDEISHISQPIRSMTQPDAPIPEQQNIGAGIPEQTVPVSAPPNPGFSFAKEIPPIPPSVPVPEPTAVGEGIMTSETEERDQYVSQPQASVPAFQEPARREQVYGNMNQVAEFNQGFEPRTSTMIAGIPAYPMQQTAEDQIPQTAANFISQLPSTPIPESQQYDSTPQSLARHYVQLDSHDSPAGHNEIPLPPSQLDSIPDESMETHPATMVLPTADVPSIVPSGGNYKPQWQQPGQETDALAAQVPSSAGVYDSNQRPPTVVAQTPPPAPPPTAALEPTQSGPSAATQPDTSSTIRAVDQVLQNAQDKAIAPASTLAEQAPVLYATATNATEPLSTIPMPQAGLTVPNANNLQLQGMAPAMVMPSGVSPAPYSQQQVPTRESSQAPSYGAQAVAGPYQGHEDAPVFNTYSSQPTTFEMDTPGRSTNPFGPGPFNAGFGDTQLRSSNFPDAPFGVHQPGLFGQATQEAMGQPFGGGGDQVEGEQQVIPSRPSPFSLGTPSAMPMAQPSPLASPKQTKTSSGVPKATPPMKFKEAPNPFASNDSGGNHNFFDSMRRAGGNSGQGSGGDTVSFL